jgi:hypothetical protein
VPVETLSPIVDIELEAGWLQLVDRAGRGWAPTRVRAARRARLNSF